MLGAVFPSLVFGDFLVWTMWAAIEQPAPRRASRGRDPTGRAGRLVAVGAGRLLGGARPPPPTPGRRAGGRLDPGRGDLCRRHAVGLRSRLPGSPETQRRGAVVAIESRNAAYATTSLAAPAGQVTVVLTNHDLFWTRIQQSASTEPGTHQPSPNQPLHAGLPRFAVLSRRSLTSDGRAQRESADVPKRLTSFSGRPSRPGRSGRYLPIRTCAAAVLDSAAQPSAFPRFWIKR